MKKEEIFGKAVFVKPDESCVSPCFRGEFCAEKNDAAEIIICGLGTFRLYINGKKVSGDVFAPVTSNYHEYENCFCTTKFGEKMKSRIYCVKYDISEYVREGKNALGVVVGPMWYGRYSADCVLCYRIKCGDKEFFSDASVKWSDTPVTEYNFTCGEKQDYLKHDYNGKWLLPDADVSDWRNTAEAQLPETEYYIQNCPNDVVIRSIECKKIYETEEYSVFDAGENITGWYVFRCPEKGRKITVTVSEEKDEKGDLHEKWVHHQSAEYICDGTDREYHLLFTWQGFRYIRIDNAAELLRVDVIHSDIKNQSEFSCQNEVLNGIYDMYVRTQLCNLHMGIPSDCPHIERRGYTGDGQLVSRDVMLLFGSRDFYLKWMEDIADSQDINSGHVQYTAPYVPSGGGPGGWGCAIAEVPYNFYKIFGDAEPFKKYFDNMLRYFDYLEAHSENGLIVSDQPGEWCLGEWCSPHEVHAMRPEIPDPFVNGYFYVRTLDRMIELCDKIGRSGDKAALIERRKEKADILVKNYFDEKTGDFAGNLNSANAFAVDIGLGDERTLQNLVEAVRTKPLDTGIFGVEVVCKVLFNTGHADEAISFLARDEYPSYGFMLRNGATTLWEEWKDPRSMSHPMFGSVVKYMFGFILGIKQADDCGYKNVIIEPKANSITGSAAGSIQTVSGKIFVSVDVSSKVCTVKADKNINVKVIYDGKIIIE